ncbi:alkaline phosphatase [Thalassotalea maritima]|uniref:alkaline phosphatase n=1 Tax=Thalassotalea maritima TaxID=3242416 RepID=UPI0035274DC0
MKKLVSVITASLLVVGCNGAEQNHKQGQEQDNPSASSATSVTIASSIKPKNIIMVVADGMGYAYPVAYRYWQDNPTTEHVETTIFDRTLVGSSSTYPLADSKTSSSTERAKDKVYVTDSAASATSLATGVKTFNGAIGVDINGQPLPTVLEVAKSLNMKTGVVATSQIVHATPASYIAKNDSRRNYNAIADDFFDLRVNGQLKADVMLGGGSDYFIRQDRNLVEAFMQHDYRHLTNLQQLNTVTNNEKLLGLFAPIALKPNINSPVKNPLLEMSKAAITALQNEQGFFLVIEASQVDWGGHANDIAYAMGEMHDLALTMEYLYQYSQQDNDTLVIMTADHETGGFSIAANGRYQFKPHYLNNITASPKSLANQLANNSIDNDILQQKLGFTLDDSERNHLPTLQLENQQQAQQQQWPSEKQQRDLSDRYYNFIKEVIDNRTNAGWTTSGHTAVDVPVFAFGPGAHTFIGHQDNIDIAAKIFNHLNN